MILVLDQMYSCDDCYCCCYTCSCCSPFCLCCSRSFKLLLEFRYNLLIIDYKTNFNESFDVIKITYKVVFKSCRFSPSAMSPAVSQLVHDIFHPYIRVLFFMYVSYNVTYGSKIENINGNLKRNSYYVLTHEFRTSIRYYA